MQILTWFLRGLGSLSSNYQYGDINIEHNHPQEKIALQSLNLGSSSIKQYPHHRINESVKKMINLKYLINFRTIQINKSELPLLIHFELSGNISSHLLGCSRMLSKKSLPATISSSQSISSFFLDLQARIHFALRMLDELGNINKAASYSPTQRQNVTD